jgi:hypothetical protein
MALNLYSPRARFQQDAKVSGAFRDLIARTESERAIDYALLEFQRVLSEGTGSFNDAAANHFKICGAQEFVHVLKNLGEPTPPLTVVPKTANLPGNK